jgi:CRP-like cAMP-binding protein
MPETDAATDCRIFDGLSDEERRSWLEAGRTRTVRRRQIVARQGEPANTFYLIETGLLKLLQTTSEGKEIIVRFVGPGEPFGGVVALEGAPYPVTALAVQPTRLRAWSSETLRRLLERFPGVRMNLMREMASHMTDALTRVRELATQRVGARLAQTLHRLTLQCGRPTPDGLLIDYPLTRQELAELTGTTLYTVSRTLSQWKADGVLRSERRRILVLSSARLEALASGAAESPAIPTKKA